MPKCIVDLFEIIKINVHDSKWTLDQACTDHFHLEDLAEVTSIHCTRNIICSSQHTLHIMGTAQFGNEIGHNAKKPKADHRIPKVNEGLRVILTRNQLGDQPGHRAQNGKSPSKPTI